MSRTERGSKPSGYEYWSARPLNKGGGCVGGFTKTQTSRIERRNSKTLVRNELDELNPDMPDYASVGLLLEWVDEKWQ